MARKRRKSKKKRSPSKQGQKRAIKNARRAARKKPKTTVRKPPKLSGLKGIQGAGTSKRELKRLAQIRANLDKLEPKDAKGDVEIDIDADMGDAPVQIRVLGDRIEKACQKAARELAEMGAAHARANAPVRTGQLRNSIGVEASDNPEVWYVAATAPHARIRHRGVKKNYIIYKHPGFMRFHPGTFTYARRWSGVRGPGEPGPGRAHEVHFIGSKADPFMTNAAAAVRAEGGKTAARIVRSSV